MRFKYPVAVGVCAIATIPLAAQAGWFSDEAPPANAKPLSAIIKTVEDRGLGAITEVEFEDGKWEIEVHQAGGNESEIHVDPIKGLIVAH